MGRKAIQRTRKELTPKVKSWVKALVPLLQDKQLNHLTLDDLAALANKSKSTIYTYFSTKEEIYQTAVKLVLDDLQYAASPNAVAGDDMKLSLQNLLQKISEGIGAISLSFLEQLKKHFKQAWQLVEHFAAKVLANLALIYKKGMCEGTFKTYNIELLTALDSHFVMNIMTNTAIFNQQGITFNGLVKEYLELRLNALLILPKG
ncbi:MAG: TetR/AcrR family transcriptional regulator [Bacteroidia bacterium]